MSDRILIIFIQFWIYSYAVDSLRFLAIGDWGGVPSWPYSTPTEKSVAKQMAAVTERYRVNFNLALGDNFYFFGVDDVNDQRFKETFEDVFHYPSLQNPWYLVAGNHDHLGNVSAQIAYSNKSERWKFPDFFYGLHFHIPGGGSLDILMLDTVLLCGNTGQVKDILSQASDDLQRPDDQLRWIEAQLNQSKADHILVAGHYPVYSIGDSGPTKCLIDKLKPLLYKYKVSAYLCGHDHNLQHISSSENDHTVEYIVSGAASQTDRSRTHKDDVPGNSLKFHWADVLGLGGFAYLEATSQNITLVFVDGFNRKLYQYTFPIRDKTSESDNGTSFVELNSSFVHT